MRGKKRGQKGRDFVRRQKGMEKPPSPFMHSLLFQVKGLTRCLIVISG